MLLINDNSNLNFSDCKYLILLLFREDASKKKKKSQDLSVHFIKGITQTYKGLNP